MTITNGLAGFIEESEGIENQQSASEVLTMDGHNLMFRTLFIAHKHEPLDDKFVYWKYLMMNSIFRTIQYNKPTKFILAFDTSNYWRKDVYEGYKAKRKKARDGSVVDFDVFFPIANEFIDQLRDIFCNWYVVKLPRIEADDIIAVSTRDIFTTAKRIVNISTDKDMYQLKKCHNYEQYDPVKRKWVECLNPQMDLDIKLLTGDSSDNIPGVKDRCGPATAKKLLDSGLDLVLEDVEMKAKYERNKTLIDFDCIPVNIKKQIIDEIQNYDIQPYDGQRAFKWMVSHGLGGYATDLQEYSNVLRALG